MKTDTQRAIEFLNDCQDDYEELQEEGNNKGILEVIKLLQEGEKYKKMWGEAKGYPESHRDLVLPDEYRGYQGGALKYIIETIEQKYFPKPKSRWQRINDMVLMLNNRGINPDWGKLVSLLIELRDEEL